ncbi:MAG: 4-hydroxy-tetrahydrodipicolinate synthase [Xanthomonadales bacterium]|nr:4-hydroxy-tetrahydrodipicolinate synthase [Xanthomonadales bacterium]
MNPDALKGSIVAVVTPMSRDGGLDLSAFRNLLSLHRAAGTRGIVVAGTTGEGASLVESEFQALLSAAVEHLDGKLPVIAGVGSPDTAKSVKLAGLAAGSGVDALLCVTPYYLKTTQEGLRRHYGALADAVDLPMVLYNVPARTGVDLLPETVEALSRSAQVIGIKEARPDLDRIQELVQRTGPGFHVLSGDDPTGLGALNNGAVGIISVTANVAPRAMQDMVDMVAGGQVDQALRLNQRLDELHRLIGREPNPIPVKAMLAALGLVKPVIRLPLMPPSAALADDIERSITGGLRDLLIA